MIVDKTGKTYLMNTKAGIFPDADAVDAMETTRGEKKYRFKQPKFEGY